MFDSDFDSWIDYYYEMDDLERIMEEEKKLSSSPKDHGRKKLDSVFVEDCLDELD